MSPRSAAVIAILDRARLTGKRVYGFASEKASCAEVVKKQGVPVEWDWLCVEGDAVWVYVGVEGVEENAA